MDLNIVLATYILKVLGVAVVGGLVVMICRSTFQWINDYKLDLPVYILMWWGMSVFSLSILALGFVLHTAVGIIFILFPLTAIVAKRIVLQYKKSTTLGGNNESRAENADRHG